MKSITNPAIRYQNIPIVYRNQNKIKSSVKAVSQNSVLRYFITYFFLYIDNRITAVMSENKALFNQ